jgi:hypothetical protein
MKKIIQFFEDYGLIMIFIIILAVLVWICLKLNGYVLA